MGETEEFTKVWESFCQDRWVLKVVSEFTTSSWWPLFLSGRAVPYPENLHQQILEKELNDLIEKKAIMRATKEDEPSSWPSFFMAPPKKKTPGDQSSISSHWTWTTEDQGGSAKKKKKGIGALLSGKMEQA